MDMIVKINKLFSELEPTHPSDSNDWGNAIHDLQKVLGLRLLRRDYPDILQSICQKQ